jgi:hypothetical protein
VLSVATPQTSIATKEAFRASTNPRPACLLDLGVPCLLHPGDIAAAVAVAAGRWADKVPTHPIQRTGRRLLATDRFDVWLLRWPPGTSVTPHDHGQSAGAFHVVEGQLQEVRWYSGLTRARTVSADHTVTVGRGIMHDVIGGQDPSLSVHVYSPPLETMSFYGGSIQPLNTVQVHESGDASVAPRPDSPSLR